jgi:DNA-binding CsgD family transcriptional regulator
MDVLPLVLSHRTNQDIAAILHLSVRTVEKYMTSLLRKTGATDRRNLAATLASLGIET